MSFQKCPVCDGTGQMPGGYTACTSIACPTCQGYRIINEQTGHPPVYEVLTSDKKSNVDDVLSTSLQFLKK